MVARLVSELYIPSTNFDNLELVLIQLLLQPFWLDISADIQHVEVFGVPLLSSCK